MSIEEMASLIMSRGNGVLSDLAKELIALEDNGYNEEDIIRVFKLVLGGKK